MDKKEEFIAICVGIYLYILANRFSFSQEMLAFNETKWFITALTMIANCPKPERDQSSPCPQLISRRSILKLASHLRLGYVLIQTKYYQEGAYTVIYKLLLLECTIVMHCVLLY